MATVLDDKKQATSRLASPNNIYPGNQLQGNSGSSGAPVGAVPKPAPAAAPAAARLAGPSELYMQDRAQEMRDQWGSGNYAQAAGTAARTAVQGLGMYGIELADKAATPVMGAAGKFASGLIGSDANAAQPVASVPPAAAASAAQAAAKPPVAQPATAAASLTPGLTNNVGSSAATAGQSAVARAAALPDGVYQHGRGQFSDQAGGMNFTPGFTGRPNAQNDALAGALDRRSQLARVGGYSYSPEASVEAGTPAASTPNVAAAGSNAGQVASAAAGQPSAQNQRAAASLAAMNSPILAEQQGGVPTFTAPAVAHSGNDWAARQRLKDMETSASSITNRAEWRSGSSTPAWGSRQHAQNDPDGKIARFNAATQADLAAQGKAPELQQRTNEVNAGMQRAAMAEAGADRRAQGQVGLGMGQLALGAQRNQLDAQRISNDERLRAPQIRAAERMGQMQEDLLNAKTPEEQAAIAARIRAYSGKDSDSWKAVALQGGTDAQGNKTESILGAVNERTGEMRRMDSSRNPPAVDSPEVQAIRNNTALTMEQRREELRKLGFN